MKAFCERVSQQLTKSQIKTLEKTKQQRRYRIWKKGRYTGQYSNKWYR